MYKYYISISTLYKCAHAHACKADRPQATFVAGTRQHDRLWMLRVKYRMVHTTSHFQIDRQSISQQLIECSTHFFHAQKIVLPCRQ